MCDFAIKNTVFERRVSAGKYKNTSEFGTRWIVDQDVLETMVLDLLSGGCLTPNDITEDNFHRCKDYVRNFFVAMSDTFGSYWPAKTPPRSDPYRVLYLHGWPFCLRAIALAYHAGTVPEPPRIERARSEPPVVHLNVEKKISHEIFFERLRKIDWHRHRQHWIDITGFRQDANNQPKTVLLRSGARVVSGRITSNSEVIRLIAEKVLSDEWDTLSSLIDYQAEILVSTSPG